MKAKYKYFIPVILFMFSWISSYIIVSNRRNAFSIMLNKAGREHQPIVWIRGISTTELTGWYISTIDENAVKLVPFYAKASISNVIFSDDGIIRISSWFDVHESTISFWNIRMPDIYTRQDSQYVNVEFNKNNTSLWQAQGEQYVVIFNSDGVQIEDYATGKTSYSQITNLPPSFSGIDRLFSGEIKIDSELTTLIYREGDWGERCIFWRYDISEGKWTAIIKREFIPFFAVGPDARIIGLKFDRPGPSESIFIDGYTGQTLHSIYGMDKFTIGDRWIACSEGISGIQRGIVLIDMDNNWEEYRLTFPCNNFNDFAMYEPPEGGVEEMQRMREGS
ncbi:MAG: hypothetical protein NTY09_01280 [bacterium]|nr:hypothetical protein [bacterium]